MKKYTELHEYQYISPYGKIKIIMDGQKVKRVIIGKFKKNREYKNKNHPIRKALDIYFKKGDDSYLKKIPLSWGNINEKQKKVLKYLQRNVKKGKTITYGELAKIFRTSPRTIGQFMKRNPFPIFVACHRVTGKKNIGGYSPDLRWKKHLLEIEKR